METKQKKTKRMKVVVSVLVLAALFVFSLFAIAGNLEPSASPGPTMKTLDEVEPRIPIHASDLPLTITEPNSYYLVENINFTDDANNAITIECNDVTIDLMGYSLIGPGSGTGCSIYMNGRSNVEIRNGVVRSFGSHGIYEANHDAGRQHRVIHVRAVSNGGDGVSLRGCGHLVKDCTAVGNASCGILAHSRCTVTGNIVFDNGTYGVKTFYGSTVTDNTAYNNQSRGIDAEHEGCTVTGNTASYNNSGIAAGGGSTVVGNTAYYNWYYGIAAGDGSLVANNVTSYNNQSNSTINAGIRVGEDCLVKGNVAHANKQYNILVGGLGFGPFTDNVIEENLVTDSANGIFFDPIAGTGNFYANNRASGNTTNYANTVGNTNGGGNFSF